MTPRPRDVSIDQLGWAPRRMRATAAPRGAFARSGSWAELGGREGSPGSGSSSPTTPSKSPARFGVTKEGASKGRGRLAIFLILVDDRRRRVRHRVDVRGAAKVRRHPGRGQPGDPRARLRHARRPRAPPAAHGGARRHASQARAQFVRVGSERRGGVPPSAVRVRAPACSFRVPRADAHRAHGHRGSSIRPR